DKVDKINSLKISVSEKIIYDTLLNAIRDGRFYATVDGIHASRESNVKIITVPIYLSEDGKPIFNAIINVSETIGKGLKKGDIVIVESSVPPYTTRNIVKPVLEKNSGLKAETDFGLAYSPERIYIGRAVKDIEENYPKIVGGIGKKSAEVAKTLYEVFVKKGVILMPDTVHAEFEKLIEGVYRDVNIALANEIAEICRNIGLDYDAIRMAANSQPYCHLHKPGVGVGGFCIPLYSYFIINTAEKNKVNPLLIKTARKINEYMPEKIVNLIEEMAEKYGLKDFKIAVLGIAFRGGIDDTRLSPAIIIVKKLVEKGYKNIAINDPYVKYSRELERLGLKIEKNIEVVLKNADIILIATDHPEYFNLSLREVYDISGKDFIIIIDGKHVFKDINKKPKEVKYIGVGKPLI
ncbi:MAG TPA: nucleotide sugar dehydrogenase, partial [Thermoprotei archaeon]|nr:nucleotide sugar dehydrogenase [Thermoprotei archaeon]